MYSVASGLGATAPFERNRPDSPARSIEKDAAAVSAAVTDRALVARFNNGDEGAFVEIMERYRPRIFSVTCGILRNHSDAEEITQDTFIRAHRALGRFRGDSSLATWLHRIAANLSRNRYWYHFRRRRHDALSLDCAVSAESEGTFSDLVADAGQSPAQEAATGEFTELISACMAQLEAGHREILTLRNVLDHPYADIARLLGINVGTVKSRIARAREKLCDLLAVACPEFDPNSPRSDWFIPTGSIYGRPVIASC